MHRHAVCLTRRLPCLRYVACHSSTKAGIMKDGLTLHDFLQRSANGQIKTVQTKPRSDLPSTSSLSFFIETYGCQMNVSDSEIVRATLLNAGHTISDSLEQADVILANTCAIRDNAEAKVWHRLNFFKSIKSKNRVNKLKPGYPIVGVLGCMAERLKTALLDEESVDFVCGPDAYRDIPLLVDIASSTDQKAANVQLSLEETYADITPVREVNSTSAFVSIMRGCNNMCAYCIVPFTRGRERSRAVESIVNEVRALASQGVKEVVLLGQNVNSYHDSSSDSKEKYPEVAYTSTPGFKNMFKSRNGPGARFAELLQEVAAVSPELRVRFTSPHPKDFPDEVLHLIATTPNICKSIHMPAQSGSSRVLEVMRRGYTREAYLELIKRAREIIPDVTISSDFISGFCSESPEEHLDTVSLLEEVKFDQAFMFAYSMRDKTHAAHKMDDDVPEEEKLRRLQEVISTYRKHMIEKNASELHKLHLVLVEGEGKKSKPDNVTLTGRSDGNKRCVFPASQTPLSSCVVVAAANDVNESSTVEGVLSLQDILRSYRAQLDLQPDGGRSDDTADRSASVSCSHAGLDGRSVITRIPQEGDYAVVRITEAKGQVLYGESIAITTLQSFHQLIGRSV